MKTPVLESLLNKVAGLTLSYRTPLVVASVLTPKGALSGLRKFWQLKALSKFRKLLFILP